MERIIFEEEIPIYSYFSRTCELQFEYNYKINCLLNVHRSDISLSRDFFHMYNGFNRVVSGQAPLEEFLLIILVLVIVIHFILNAILSSSNKFGYQKLWGEKQIPNSNRILFVIAHPDDECLFFGPTILAALRNNPSNTYILCLSTGLIFIFFIHPFFHK